MKLSDLKINSDAVEQGAWVNDIADMPDLRLKVRGFGNVDDRRIQDLEYQKLPRALKVRGNLSPAGQDAIMTKRLLGAILVDWDGLTGDDDKPIPYSKEMAEQLLSDKQYSPFRRAVLWAASIVESETKEGREEDAKN